MAKDKSKSLVLTIHLAKATMYTLYTDFKKRRQINIDLQRTYTSNPIKETQKQAVSIATHEQSTRHHQSMHSFRLVLISTQTGHGVHILVYTYVHDFTHTSMHR